MGGIRLWGGGQLPALCGGSKIWAFLQRLVDEHEAAVQAEGRLRIGCGAADSQRAAQAGRVFGGGCGSGGSGRNHDNVGDLKRRMTARWNRARHGSTNTGKDGVLKFHDGLQSLSRPL
jgi:hypothetical protein